LRQTPATTAAAGNTAPDVVATPRSAAAAAAAGALGAAGPAAGGDAQPHAAGGDAHPHAGRGYAETAGASLVNGSVGVMVSFAAMPTGMLVPLRTLFAALFLAPLALRRGRLAAMRAPGVPIRLLGMGVLWAGNLFCYFVSIRYAGVAAAIFLTYMAPVYLAVAAPRVLGDRTDRTTLIALAVAVAGMLVIVLPGLLAGGGQTSPLGIAAGIASGLFYGGNLLALKSMQGRLEASSMIFAESLVTAVLLLPLGIYEVVTQNYVFTAKDVLIAAMLGLIPAAIGFTLFVHGLQYIKVQHGAIIGYLEPVSAPIYALIILGQWPSGWTVMGGALIVLAGVIVILKGRAAEAPA
jgi:drug/metabolite transporter (DMT)-like permease